jgi:hypothetical protein
MSRNVNVVILCEDSQHEAFIRRFLDKRKDVYRVTRVVKSPKGRGSGEQFVRVEYSKELRFYRERQYRVGQMLIVMIDGDKHTVAERLEQVEAGCADANEPRRAAHEHVAIFVPMRSIETRFAYLDGTSVEEIDTAYPKLDRERDCQRHADVLAEMCQQSKLREPVPMSLQQACAEYQKRISQ